MMLCFFRAVLLPTALSLEEANKNKKRGFPAGKSNPLKSNLNTKLSESDSFLLAVRFSWAGFTTFFVRNLTSRPQAPSRLEPIRGYNATCSPERPSSARAPSPPFGEQGKWATTQGPPPPRTPARESRCLPDLEHSWTGMTASALLAPGV